MTHNLASLVPAPKIRTMCLENIMNPENENGCISNASIQDLSEEAANSVAPLPVVQEDESEQEEADVLS